MPTYKHPCPYCSKFIDRAAAACPYCGVAEPFSPKRCTNCRRIIEDPAWTTCPGCGMSLVAPPPGAAAQAGGRGAVPGWNSGKPAQPAAQPAPAAGSAPAAPAPSSAAAPAAAAPAAVAGPPAGKCSGCGAPLSAGARFCTVCGTLAG